MATVEERHPELFEPRLNVVPRGFKRTVPMEVLSLGHLRTGTATMSTALNILGLKCYHSMLWMSSNFGDLPLVSEAVDARYSGKGKPWTTEDFDQIFHDFGAVSEMPAITMVPEMLAAYPNAKIILVERDIESWYESFDKAIVSPNDSAIIRWVVTLDIWYLGPISDVVLRMLWYGWMGARTAAEMRIIARDHYRAHYKLVRDLTPPHLLLEYKLTNGWSPLCQHLEKPVPDVPFPRVNETEWFQEMIGILIRRRVWALTRAALAVLAPALLLVAGILMYRY